MATKVVMPEMGEGVTEATIIRWLKNEGDTIDQYEPLVEVNTDKVDSEVPSPVSGTILKIMGAPDAVVSVEQTLCWIGAPGEEIPEEDAAAPAPKAAAPAKPDPVIPAAPVPSPPASVPSSAPPPPLPLPSTPPAGGASLTGAVSPLAARVAAAYGVEARMIPGTGSGGQVTKNDVLRYLQNGSPAPAASPAAERPARRNAFISPVVARLSAENGIDLARVTGTGLEGRITKKDIERVVNAGGVDPLVAAPLPGQGSAPAQPAGPAGPVEAYAHMTPGTIMKLSPVRRSIAKHMRQSVDISPHVTTVMEADMSAVWAHRAANKAAFAADGTNLTFTAYFVAAVVKALKAYAIVNSSWSEEGVVLHKEINIGMAVSMDADGLIVPVIRNADSLSLLGASRAVNDLAERARTKQLNPEEVRGGTFTITNHGTSGSLFATPIINQPQCGILGTGAIQKRAVVINDAIAIRPMAYISLTFDHRILDGAVADYFLGTVKNTLEGWA